MKQGKVYFIGAGPGDPELITVKGQRLVAEADLVLYAGSLVPKQVVECAKPGAIVRDSSPMTLEQTHALLLDTVRGGGTAARVHTGDPSLYGAVREQARLLDRDQVEHETIPGVTAAFASAALGNVSFTVPGGPQSLIITRMSGRTPVREEESLAKMAAHGCALAIYLSADKAVRMREELLEGGLDKDTLAVIGVRAGHPDQAVYTTTVDELPAVVERHKITRQAVFMVLPGQGMDDGRSLLYAPDFSHGFRQGETGEE